MARLMETYGDKYSFEAIYEYYMTLRTIVSKKKRGATYAAFWRIALDLGPRGTP